LHNFYFYFSVTNNRNEKLYFDPRPIYSNHDFFRIYNLENKDFGTSFNFNIQPSTTIGIGAFPFPEDYTHIYQVSWFDKQETIWILPFTVGTAIPQEPLPKGNYYSGFKQRFRFAVPYEADIYDTLSFKINFIIK